MNKTEYKDYEGKVSAFFEAEGITNLSRVIPENEEVYGECLTCNDLISIDESFSSQPCDCCGTTLGGSRIHASGFNFKTQEIQCYHICTDCEYFAEYGQLDDMTMIFMEG